MVAYTGRMLIALSAALLCAASTAAEPKAPWGTSEVEAVEYAPHKVVYDVSTPDKQTFSRVLDRASFLNNLYESDPFAASIVLVLHGDEIGFFDIDKYAQHQELMTRAQSLTVGGVIKIKMCRVAARERGLEPAQIHGFVEMVPMADAEIVRLQQEEDYAYMR